VIIVFIIPLSALRKKSWKRRGFIEEFEKRKREKLGRPAALCSCHGAGSEKKKKKRRMS